MFVSGRAFAVIVALVTAVRWTPLHASDDFLTPFDHGHYGAWAALAPKPVVWIPGDGLDNDDSGEPIVCEVDENGVAVACWYGELALGEKIPVVDEVPNTAARWATSGMLPKNGADVPSGARRVVLLSRDVDEPHGVKWAFSRWLHCVFWLEGDRIVTVGTGASRSSDEIPFVSLPRWIGSSCRGFEDGPRMTERQLRTRLVEWAARRGRQAAHRKEMQDATTRDELVAALAAYRCEYGVVPAAWKQTALAMPVKSHALAPSEELRRSLHEPEAVSNAARTAELGWSTDGRSSLAALMKNDHFMEARGLIGLQLLQADPVFVRSHVIDRLQQVRSSAEAEYLQMYLQKQRSQPLWPLRSFAVDARDTNSAVVFGSFFSLRERRENVVELGWSALAFQPKAMTFADRREVATLLLLHEAAAAAENSPPSEEERAVLETWSEQFADDGPLAKKLDKDIPFAQKILGYQAGVYLMKFRRPKDAAPVEPEKPAEAAAKPGESRDVEPSPARAENALPPSRWPSFVMAIACLAIGAVLGRWSGR